MSSLLFDGSRLGIVSCLRIGGWTFAFNFTFPRRLVILFSMKKESPIDNSFSVGRFIMLEAFSESFAFFVELLLTLLEVCVFVWSESTD